MKNGFTAALTLVKYVYHETFENHAFEFHPPDTIEGLWGKREALPLGSMLCVKL